MPGSGSIFTTFSKGSLSVEHFMMDLLMRRAAAKLDITEVGFLLGDASRALQQAGSWKDAVTVQVCMKKRVTSTRTVRLLHGVPSPRLQATSAPRFPRMVAKDAIYFFAKSDRERADRLQSALPALNDEHDLAAWLESFSSTRFEKQLIEALVGHMDSPIFRPAHSQGTAYICMMISLIAAEIDRLAWFSGQSSMTIANAAPVWRPK